MGEYYAARKAVNSSSHLAQNLLGVTLWVVPPTEDMERLKTIMHMRKDQPHSASSYPEFTPHITLASLSPSKELSLPTLRASIPTSQSVLAIEFQLVDVGSVFFRSVYISVKCTSVLTALHQHVHAALGVDPHTPSFPHISLCYIDDEDAERGERQKFHQDLLERVHLEKDKNVSLNCKRPGEPDDWMNNFRAEEIWIVNCVGPVGDWEVLEKIPLVNSLSQHQI